MYEYLQPELTTNLKKSDAFQMDGATQLRRRFETTASRVARTGRKVLRRRQPARRRRSGDVIRQAG